MARRPPAVLARRSGFPRAAIALGAAWLVWSLVAAALPDAGRDVGTVALAAVSAPLLAAAVVATAGWLHVRPLAAAATVAVGAAVALVGGVLDVDAITGLGKAAGAGAAGILLARVLEHPWNAGLIAAAIAVIDIYSVFAGPTKAIVDDRPGLLNTLTVPLAVPGDGRAGLIGMSDVVFLGLFAAVVFTFALRLRPTAVLMVLSFSATILLATWTDRALPALPLLALAFALPNLRALARPRSGGPAPDGEE